jgi:hypothetical protein
MANLLEVRQKGWEKEIERLRSELSWYKKIAISRELVTRKMKKEMERLMSKFSQSKIEKRLSNRLVVSLFGEIVTIGTSNLVLIENLSKNGLYMRISPSEAAIDYGIGEKYEVKFKLPSREILNLYCNIIWSYTTPPHGLIKCTGSEIINLSSKYKEFLKTLQ